MIIITTTRDELGRGDPSEKWGVLNENLKRWSRDSEHTLAVINRCNAERIHHFIGLNLLVFPRTATIRKLDINQWQRRSFFWAKCTEVNLFKTFSNPRFESRSDERTPRSTSEKPEKSTRKVISTLS